MSNKKKKSNKKLLLLATFGLVGILGGTIGGTYAWLTANRTASATIPDTGITSSGNLEIKLHAATEWNSTVNFSLGDLRDVSGDGETMFRPVLSPDSTEVENVFSFVTPLTPIIDGGDATYAGYVFQETIDYRSNLPLCIYFDTTTDISAGTAGTSVYKALRIAALSQPTSADDDSSREVIAYLHNSDDTACKYVKSTTITDGALDLSDSGLAADKLLNTSSITRRTSTETTEATSPLLCTLVETSAGSKIFQASVTFRFWFEGNDKNCVSTSLNPDFAGATMTKNHLSFYALNPEDNYTPTV